MSDIKKRMNTSRPNRKVTNGAVAGALTTIILWVLAQSGLETPAGLQGAITILIIFITQYITRPGGGEEIVLDNGITGSTGINR